MSKCLKVNLGKTKVVSRSITKDNICMINVYLCGIFGLMVTAKSALCGNVGNRFTVNILE